MDSAFITKLGFIKRTFFKWEFTEQKLELHLATGWVKATIELKAAEAATTQAAKRELVSDWVPAKLLTFDRIKTNCVVSHEFSLDSRSDNKSEKSDISNFQMLIRWPNI